MAKNAKQIEIQRRKAARIDYIVEMMREPGRFNAGREYAQLLKRFDIGLEAIKRDCAEASRIVRREINDPDYVAVDVGKAMSEALAQAVAILASNPEDEIKLKAIAQIKNISHSWAAIVGADAPMRIEQLNVECTPARALQLMKEAAGDVTPDE